VSPERDDSTEDQELYEDIPPRSIFAATWFRVVLVLIVLGVIGAVAVPYVLDWMNPPPLSSRSASMKATSPAPPATPISPLPASESTAPSSAEKSAEKKDLAPVPTPAPPPALARPEPKPAPVAKAPAPKSESKSTPSVSTDSSAKSSMAATDSTPKAATKSESSAKSESTPKAAAPPKSDSAKTEAAPKSQAVAKAEPAAKDEAKRTAPASATTPKAGGPFWVQVGAFKDPDIAKRVATALRDQNYKVEQTDRQVSAKAAAAAASSSTAPLPAASPGDLYDVHVSGMSAVELTKRLSAKGLAAETAGGTVVVKPSLPLRDAVTLSKDLAVDGLKVQVRRAGSAPAPSAPATPPPATASAGETLHRVRVGAFTDVAEARAAVKELEAKGYKPYIARGNE
jgi:hypothetical protein